MMVENECVTIYNQFNHQPFTFEMLEQFRKERQEKPYTVKEKILILSYLQRNYGAKKNYRNTLDGFLTIITIPKVKEVNR
jgi:hypothetical protein